MPQTHFSLASIFERMSDHAASSLVNLKKIILEVASRTQNNIGFYSTALLPHLLTQGGSTGLAVV